MVWRNYVATSTTAVAAADNKVVGDLQSTHQKSVQGIGRRRLTWGGDRGGPGMITSKRPCSWVAGYNQS